jgi:hypothetical protein
MTATELFSKILQ